MTEEFHTHISKTPGVCGGRACIAGHRVRVMDIVVLHEKREMSPEEIQHQYPGISLVEVYAALSYYLNNQEEIQAEFRKDEEWAEWASANIPSKLRDARRG